MAADAGATAQPPEPGPWASAWTEPAAVARLASDCNYRTPAGGVPDEGDPLACETDIEEQSCTYDPCHENVNLPCRRVCGRTCTGCDARCRASCGRCRAACRDPACVLACATSCGGCLQGCLAAKDRCASAGCTASYQACSLRSARRFREGPCLAACARCQTSCPEGEDNHAECLNRCLSRGRACTPEERNHCAWEGTAYGLAEMERLGDAGVDAAP